MNKYKIFLSSGGYIELQSELDLKDFLNSYPGERFIEFDGGVVVNRDHIIYS